jgi:hypothetical protein
LERLYKMLRVMRAQELGAGRLGARALRAAGETPGTGCGNDAENYVKGRRFLNPRKAEARRAPALLSHSTTGTAGLTTPLVPIVSHSSSGSVPDV